MRVPGSRWGRAGGVALLFGALTVGLAYPLSLHPADHVFSDSPDNRLFIWTLAWDAHALAHDPLSIFDANIYYPERHTLAYSENLIGAAPVAAPIIWLTRNPVLALNVVSLLSIVLSGVGAYWLGRRVGLGRGGALVCGVVFAFAPPRFLRIDQLHLTLIQWMPFGLAALHAYFDEGRPRDLRLAVAFFTLQALSSGHGAVFLGLAMAGLAVYRAATRTVSAGARVVRDFGLTGAALLAPVLLILPPYRAAQVDVGLRRTLVNWAISAQSWLASPSHLHRLLLSLVPGWQIDQHAGAYLFPGILPLVLAACVLLPFGRRPKDLAFYALLTLGALLLSIGGPLSLWPYVYWLPGFDFIRVPSRFTLLAMLGLAVLAGAGFDRLARRVAPQRTGLVTAAAVAWLVAEFAVAPFQIQPFRVEIPAVDRWLASQPEPFVVAEVPLADPASLGAWERRHTLYMLHSTAHWQPTIEGYSGIRPALFTGLYRELTNFPDDTSLRHLAEIGVTRIVVHTDYYDPADWSRVRDRIADFQGWLRLLHVDDSGRVYELHLPEDARAAGP